MHLQSYVLPHVTQLILGKDTSSRKGYTYHLFVLPNDPEKTKWDGPTIGAESAIKTYLADEVSTFNCDCITEGHLKYPHLNRTTSPPSRCKTHLRLLPNNHRLHL